MPKSSTTGPSSVGHRRCRGGWCRAGAGAAGGATRWPAPPLLTVAIRISSPRPSRSAYSPSRPMWPQSRSGARREAESPGPRQHPVEQPVRLHLAEAPLAVADDHGGGLVLDLEGHAAGTGPFWRNPTYWGTRITPWESCPRRFAPTRLSATRSASSAGKPAASNNWHTNAFRLSEVTVGTSKSPHCSGSVRVPWRDVSRIGSGGPGGPSPARLYHAGRSSGKRAVANRT